MQTIAEILSAELGQKLQYIENVIALMDEGNTIPFIARYKKEIATLKEEKNNLDVEARMAKTQKTETITKQIELPQNFLDQNKEKNDSNKEDLTN